MSKWKFLGLLCLLAVPVYAQGSRTSVPPTLAYCLNGGAWIPMATSASGSSIASAPAVGLYGNNGGSLFPVQCDTNGNLILSGGVTSVNGVFPNASGALTLNTLTGVSLFAALPACAAGNVNNEQQVTDVGHGGSYWICTFDQLDNAYEWEPKNGTFNYAILTVPFIMPSSGTMANNGAVTLTTALDITYSGGAYMYFPAGAIVAGSIAGYYWTVMSSGTVGQVFNNPLYYTIAAGATQLPAAASSTCKSPAVCWVSDSTGTGTCTGAGGSTFLVPCQSNGTTYAVVVQPPYNITPPATTAFSSTGPGAYTQTTGSQIKGANPFVIQGGIMGTRGELDMFPFWVCNNTPNAHAMGTAWSVGLQSSSGAMATSSNTSNVSVSQWFPVRNIGSASVNWIPGSATGWSAATGGSQASNNTANYSVTADTMQLATATDYIVEKYKIIRVTR